jgi:hypothetical protein
LTCQLPALVSPALAASPACGGLAAACSVSAGWRHSRSVSHLLLVGSTSPTEQQSSAGDERLCLTGTVERTLGQEVVAVDVARLVERIKTRVEHEADKRFFVIGAWLYRRTNGRIVRLRHRRALILTASGRRSGLPRSVLLQFFPDGHDCQEQISVRDRSPGELVQMAQPMEAARVP